MLSSQQQLKSLSTQKLRTVSEANSLPGKIEFKVKEALIQERGSDGLLKKKSKQRKEI
jgi:hypothetical protein